MDILIGLYLSGTGNTKHCIEKIISELDCKAKTIPLESNYAINEIKSNDIIILGYPVQFSNAPFMVRDFIQQHSDIWKNKKILCVATMGAFSGDGAGCTARLLKKYGAEILGGLHLQMPDSVCDSKLLKKTPERNRKIIINTDNKIEKTVKTIKSGKYPQEGINILYHIAGLFGQRLWFYKKTTGYTNKLKINNSCIGCGLCSKICPMQNIKIENFKAIPDSKCTMCYRCISHCPQKAITLLGNKVYEQCLFEQYL